MLTQEPRDSPPSFMVTNGEGGSANTNRIQPEFVSNAPADGRGSARRYAYLLTKKDVAAGRELPRTFCVLSTASSGDRQCRQHSFATTSRMVAGATRDSGIASRAGFD